MTSERSNVYKKEFGYKESDPGWGRTLSIKPDLFIISNKKHV